MILATKIHNKNVQHKAIKSSDLLGNFKTILIKNRPFVSHFQLAHLFASNPLAIADALDRFAHQQGQHDTVEQVGFLRYADVTAFRALAAECHWDSAWVNAVCAALEFSPSPGAVEMED